MTIKKYHNRLLWEDYTFLNSIELYREIEEAKRQPETYTVYVPLIINKERVIQKLRELMERLGDCDYRNETEYKIETDKLIRQIYAFDELVKQESGIDSRHSKEAVELAQEFVEVLMMMTDDDGETYPYEEILDLSQEYELGIEEEDIY